ncbi:LacI family transcriptional regulator [Herbiconiux moechotypicola]|uniref:LacI family DNA-binding transcriptional regulator n=1 Tax=Herbiconiux moechotypicola TaxID=637393 RepID=A0ABN3E7X2_9MICO|nr:LacI family DNA-binding transcriptional regulator [Herbiconiux moechotypicola]MCS5732000.1 LacI family transcriptional regulator [Herbiconiux moechotypicola]
MRATRADVARRADVSPALVSYVLNGGPRSVSDAARARIEKAIAELDYRPDSIAQAFRGSTTKTVGLLTASPSNPFFAELAQAVENSVYRRGNTLLIGITDDDRAREQDYVRTFVDRRVDGILLLTSHLARNLALIEPYQIPVVVLDRVRAEYRSPVSSVHMDNVAGAVRAVEHLQWHGHRRIGCITGNAGDPVSLERVDGWRRQQNAAGFDADPDLVAYAGFTAPSGREAAHRLLAAVDGADRPTAIFVASDVQALGVLRACKDIGLSVPDDVAIVSLDGTHLSSMLVPSLTAVAQPIESIADAAIEDLLARAENPEIAPAAHTFEGRIVIGESCGCQAGS